MRPENSLLKLDSRVRPLAEQLLLLAREANIALAVINTLRTPEEQAHYLTIGTSWTLRSKHLPQPPEGLATAFDVCPVKLLTRKGWDPGDEAWQVVGKIGESLGLVWGGRWKQRDMGHFELHGEASGHQLPPIVDKQMKLPLD